MKYSVVIDAGSSGSRVFVYSWPDPDVYIKDLLPNSILRKALLPIEIHKDGVLKVQPGISSYVGSSSSNIYKQHLSKLLNRAMKVVPPKYHRETPIYFLATAGLRLVEEAERKRLLTIVCHEIQKRTNFLINNCTSQVTMIDGQTEGLYGWLGLNYLVHWGLARQWTDFEETYGFLDMGGASAQLSYALPQTSEHHNDLHKVTIRNAGGDTVQWHVFVQTWLGFGANQSIQRFRNLLQDTVSSEEKNGYTKNKEKVPLFDPCMPSGAHVTTNDFIYQGSGDFLKCESEIRKILMLDEMCLDEPCLFDGVHVPEFDVHNKKFIGVSEYWYTMHELFGTKGKFDYETLKPKVKMLCSTDWSILKRQISKGQFIKSNGIQFKSDEIKEACFKSTYVLTILKEGFKFPMTPDNPTVDHNFQDSFQSAMEIEGAEISWTLGRTVLYASSQIKSYDNENVGVTLLDGSFVPGGGHTSYEISEVTTQKGTNYPFLFISLCVILMLVCFGFGDNKFGKLFNKVPMLKRFKRKLRRLLWSEDIQQRTANRIGYGFSFPHAEIPLSTLSKGSIVYTKERSKRLTN